MTREIDRIPVPTNGRGPRPVEPAEPSTAAPGATSATSDEADRALQTVAFSPTQLAVGFGILASLILLVLGRRRGRGK
jgi:hypothetical protein